MPKLVVPEELNRNSPRAAREGAVRTGARLIELATAKMGLSDLRETDVLDVGCGVRFTETFLNEDIPVKSYSGVDVHRPLIDFLRGSVQDTRFSFAHWDVHNAMYNPGASQKMTKDTPFPFDGPFDAIWAFSVFTHMEPTDTSALLSMLRNRLRPTGKLFFSAFLRPGVATFEDKDPENPLLRAAYGEGYLRELVTNAGLTVLSVDAPDAERLIQHQVLCAPS